MKYLSITLLILCFHTTIIAQTSDSVRNIVVRGVVIDSTTSKPIISATIEIQSATTNSIIKSTTTGNDGRFVVEVPGGLKYYLTVVFVGYQQKKNPFISTSGIIDLGKISIRQSPKQLNQVSITQYKSVIKQEVDRLTYDVQADPESKIISALDMMRKVPLLSIDGNDKIRLKGSANYKILINGRESAIMAKSPSDILRSMPATNIERIEVITTPPAKYDAEGLAGIINIVTKRKNVDQGYNGSINSKYNTVLGPSINLNGTAKTGKLGIAGFVGFSHQPYTGTNFEILQKQFITNSTLKQNGINNSHGNLHYGDVELSYDIDSLHLLTGSFIIYGNNRLQGWEQTSNQTDDAGTLMNSYNLLANGNSYDKAMDAAINYQLGFRGRKDEFLTLSYKYSYSPGNQFSNNIFSDRLNTPHLPDYRQYNNSGNKEHTIQLDFARSLKSVTIETGAKAIFRDNFSHYEQDNRDSLTNSYLVSTDQTNSFSYQQNIYSLYNSYQTKINKITVKGGLRLESTFVFANFDQTPLDKKYNDLIPSVSLQRNFKNSSVNVGFTQRIQRPGIYQLNPFIDRTNPRFISTGNPDLHPELNNTFELTYSNFSKGFISASLSYMFSNNAIQNVTNINTNHSLSKSADTSATVTTFQNLGSNHTLGLNLSSNYPLTKKLFLNLNARFGHIWLMGTFNGQLYRNNGYSGTAFESLSYKFNSGYRLGLDAGYYSGDVTLQGKNGNDIYSSFVISKEFFKKSLNISFVSNNPYSQFRTFKSYTNTSDYSQSTFYQNHYRSFAIRLNYRFGKLKTNIKKNKYSIINDDVKGGAKNMTGNQ